MAKVEKKSGLGKKLPKQLKLSDSYMQVLENLTRRDVDMNINLWYNKDVEQWRWTLSSSNDSMDMESGNASELEVAMRDVKNTIEWMISPSLA
tara:strand:+ start:4579 stop:4857 length:279 start_codon:yes stop_codon:yes gene_type:complete